MPQLKPTRGICLNRSHPLSRGFVGLWLFNEGSGKKVYDLSGNGHNGIFGAGAASPSWTPGKFGSAINFDGGDHILIDNPTSFEFGTSDYTIIAGIKRNGTGNNDKVFCKGADASWEAKAKQFYIYNDKLRWEEHSVGNVESASTIDANPHQISVTFVDSSNLLSLYIDGLLDNSGTLVLTADDASHVVKIGARDTAHYTGRVDYFYIYNRALSASEVALLYREPFCMFGRVNRPELIGGQIVNLAGSSVALSSLSATAKVMRKVGGNVVGTSDVAALLNSIRSLLKVERDWLREALFNGMTANAFKLGTTLSLGWFWVRVAGCSVLYRGSSMGKIDFVNILAVAEQDACEISPPNHISHNSGSTYFYVVRRFNNCGYQERTLAASVKVSIESNGELAEPQPNKVFDSGAELVDGNKIQLVWYYCPLEQKSQPMCFNVYYDGRTGQINYENPLAIIGYKGRKFYSYQCGALEAGRYLFAIRTEDVSGIENSSLARLRIQFDPKNPDAIDILSAEGV